MRIIVTGGLGFIGSAVVRLLIDEGEHEVLNRGQDDLCRQSGVSGECLE